MRGKSLVLLVLGLSGMMLFTGCFSSNPKDIEAFARPWQVMVTEANYRLQPPDEIKIYSTKIPEINEQHQQVRPDGKVSFEGLGEFDVAGKTCDEVAKMLQDKAAQLYTLTGEQPIDVRVDVFKSHYYYVVGEVTTPGPKLCTGRDRLLYAIADAGPQVTGWWKRIQVVRPSANKNEKPKVFEVNYNKMIKDGDTSKDVYLQEGDIVYVPPTPLAAVAMVIEEFMRPIGRALAPVYTVTQIQRVQ